MTTHDLPTTVHRDAVGIMGTAKKEGTRETAGRTSIPLANWRTRRRRSRA